MEATTGWNIISSTVPAITWGRAHLGDSKDGASPRGGLKLYGRTLYGTASMGGKLGGGSLFQLRL